MALNKYWLVGGVKTELKRPVLHEVLPETVSMNPHTYFLLFVNSCGTNGSLHFQNVNILFRRQEKNNIKISGNH